MYLRNTIVKKYEERIINLGIPYTKTIYGATSILSYDDKNMYFIGSVGQEKLEGIHIIGNAKNYIIKNVDSFSMDKKIKDKDLIYTWWDREQCKNLINSEIGMMDIDRCYWSTAKILGYLDEKTYQSGMLKHEYKKACNIVIGSLAMPKYVMKYDGKGELISSKFVEADERTKCARRNVINYVGQLSLAAYQEFEGSIFMFQTDCFYYDKKIESQLKSYIEKNGYSVKINAATVSDFIDNKVSSILELSIEGEDEPKKYNLSEGRQIKYYL